MLKQDHTLLDRKVNECDFRGLLFSCLNMTEDEVTTLMKRYINIRNIGLHFYNSNVGEILLVTGGYNELRRQKTSIR